MKTIFLIAFVVTIMLVAGCSHSSSLRMACPGTFYLKEATGQEIISDAEAFEILKEYHCTYDSSEGKWVEDCVDEQMTLEEAIGEPITEDEQETTTEDLTTQQAGDIPQPGILHVDTTIQLDTGETVSGVWMLFDHKAVDTQGNIYDCKYN